MQEPRRTFFFYFFFLLLNCVTPEWSSVDQRETKSQRRDLLLVQNSLTGGWDQGRIRLCSQVTRDRTKGSALKLHQGKFRWDIRKKLCKESIVELWHELPRPVLGSPSLQGFKNLADMAFGDMGQ